MIVAKVLVIILCSAALVFIGMLIENKFGLKITTAKDALLDEALAVSHDVKAAHAYVDAFAARVKVEIGKLESRL